jgi:hypothetical protein
MADKVPVKTAVIISFMCGIILILCACMVPVDFQAFLDDPAVQDVIESTKGKVIIDPDSDDFDNLTPGDHKISGFTSGKYYMLEESDEDGTFTRNLFIKADGKYLQDLKEVGRLVGNQIGDLKNNYTYKVKSARPFVDGTYNYFAFTDTAAKSADVTNGAITIIGTDGTDYFLNLASVIKADTNRYEVMKKSTSNGWGNSCVSAKYISTNPSVTKPIADANDTQYERYNKYGTSKFIGIFQYTSAVKAHSGNISLNGMSIIDELSTQSDYIFAEYDEDGKVVDFIVLSVTRMQPVSIKAISGVTVPRTRETAVTAITENDEYSGTVTWSPDLREGKFEANKDYTATITLMAKLDFTFYGVSADYFTVQDATSVEFNSSTGIITAKFSKTLPITVTIKAIEGVSAPKTGETAATAITENNEYSGTVTWSPDLREGKFEANKDYTATITLKAKPDFTFTGVSADYFTVQDATSVEFNSSTGIITAKFSKTGNATENVGITTISIEYASNNSPSVNVNSTSVSQNSNGSTIIIEVTNSSEYTATAFEWYKDGVKLATTTASYSFVINDDNNSYNKQPGVHLITVVGYVSSIPYSTLITITVNTTP